MRQVLIFAGTTEGRRLAEDLSAAQVPVTVSVATEYGESLLPEGPFVTRLAGRLDAAGMADLMKTGDFLCVADATHPYAAEVSANIKEAADEAGLKYLRVLREEEEAGSDVIYADSVNDAADYLAGKDGNILAATGSKELDKYTCLADYRTRVFARVLSTEESVSKSRALGFEGKNLICMQGPFSEELNYATMKQYDIKWLVTKESGRTGGFGEKIRAARRAGAKVVVVGRPAEAEKGCSFSEAESTILAMAGCDVPKKKRKVSFVSIGTGASSQLTGEALKVLEDCDAVVGAGRMVEAASAGAKPVFSSYKNEEIADWIESHGQYGHIAVAFSGDLGFYSGAKKLLPLMEAKGYETECIPGISSLIYLAARVGTSWDDAKLMSMHGRNENIIRAVCENKKVFTLLGGAGSAKALCEELIEYDLTDVRVTVGESLSYEGEKIKSGKPAELYAEDFGALAVALIENPVAEDAISTHGIDDEEFIRDKVPMTKYEVRSVSLSRLKLKKDSVVYDIGAGTGSISIEAALNASDGRVYAIEKKPEAIALLRENKKKFRAANIEVVEGLAPEALKGLEPPTHAFIGGSSGNMKEIIGVLLEKNPNIRIVINAIALETVSEAMEAVKAYSVTDFSVSQVMASRGKQAGNYEMMMGMNPVYIISFTGGESADGR